MKVLKYLALIYFFSLIVLLSKTVEEPDCINSITVQSINIERDQESVFTPSCYFGKEAQGVPVLSDKKTIKNLNSVIESFERTIHDKRWFYKPAALKIVIKNTANLIVTSKDIEMNFEQVKDLNLVRKSLIKAWLLNFSSTKIKNDKFALEVVSDVFLYLFWNETNWKKDSNSKTWLKYVYSEMDICQTPFAPSEKITVCDLISTQFLKEEQTGQISSWSLRPLLVNRIIKIYDQMSLEQKINFSKYWMKVALSLNPKFSEKTLTFSNFSEVHNNYLNILMSDFLNLKFDEQFVVDYLFDFNIPQAKNLLKNRIVVPYHTQNIVFKFSDNTFLNLRNGSKISSNKGLAKHWVLIQRSFPELQEVKGLPADYLTIIQAKKDYDLTSFPEKIGDISGFPWPDEFDSLSIYIPSLKLLGQLAPKELLNSDIRSLSLNPRVIKILGWSPVQVY